MFGLLGVAAASEAVAGLTLTLFPRPVVLLLLGVDVTDAGLAMTRIAGIALVALGIACWPGANTRGPGDRGRTAMLVYGVLVGIYLSGLGIDGNLRGPLLWPAVAGHLVVSALLARPRTIRPD